MSSSLRVNTSSLHPNNDISALLLPVADSDTFKLHFFIEKDNIGNTVAADLTGVNVIYRSHVFDTMPSFAEIQGILASKFNIPIHRQLLLGFQWRNNKTKRPNDVLRSEITVQQWILNNRTSSTSSNASYTREEEDEGEHGHLHEQKKEGESVELQEKEASGLLQIYVKEVHDLSPAVLQDLGSSNAKEAQYILVMLKLVQANSMLFLGSHIASRADPLEALVEQVAHLIPDFHSSVDRKSSPVRGPLETPRSPRHHSQSSSMRARRTSSPSNVGLRPTRASSVSSVRSSTTPIPEHAQDSALSMPLLRGMSSLRYGNSNTSGLATTGSCSHMLYTCYDEVQLEHNRFDCLEDTQRARALLSLRTGDIICLLQKTDLIESLKHSARQRRTGELRSVREISIDPLFNRAEFSDVAFEFSLESPTTAHTHTHDKKSFAPNAASARPEITRQGSLDETDHASGGHSEGIIYAHRAILALQSSYFAKMFRFYESSQSSRAASGSGEGEEKDTHSWDSSAVLSDEQYPNRQRCCWITIKRHTYSEFFLMIKWMYGLSPITPSVAEQLLGLADEFLFEKLKGECVAALTPHIDTGNALTMLALSHKANSAELRAAALGHLFDHAEQIDKVQLKRFCIDKPHLSYEVVSFFIDERVVAEQQEAVQLARLSI
jgi:hypothetical protein